MTEFKHGDTVRINDPSWHRSKLYMQTGVIERSPRWYSNYPFLFFVHPINTDDEGVPLKGDEFELVKEKEVTTEFQVGDKVSVTGTVTEIYGQKNGKAITVDFDGGSSIDTEHEGVACVWDNQVTLIERAPEKEIPVGTIVDSIEGKYVLGSYEGNFGTYSAWIRFVGSGGNVWATDSEKGKILSKIARESL